MTAAKKPNQSKGRDVADHSPNEIETMARERANEPFPPPAGETTAGSAGPGPFSSNAPTDWPRLAPAALYGLAGDLVRLVEPATEADPVAVLFQFLCAFGNAVGRRPFYRVERTRHYLNVFVTLVGDTAAGRKGTSLRWAVETVEKGDPSWSLQRTSGLSSGEGLIHAVRDPSADPNGDKGVADKRLFVVESEFASVLQRMGRESNVLSSVIRQAWDDGHLQTMTRKDPMEAHDAHVSIVAHITRTELLKTLNDTETGNGFANRYLWLCVKRSKCLPHGGHLDLDSLNSLNSRVGEAIAFAKTCGALVMTQKAEALWEKEYPRLTEGHPGLLGTIVSRAAPQTLRLACIYALLDCKAEVDDHHLRAGLACWAYAEDSAKFIFGDSLGDPLADDILVELRASTTGLTQTELTKALGNHAKAGKMARALQLLQSQGLICSTQEPSAGRTATRWHAKEANKAKEGGSR